MSDGGNYMADTGIERPTGVQILAVLEILGGVLGIIAGLSAGSGFGMGTLLIGLVNFAIGWGLWELKKWAYQVALILAILGFIGALILSLILIGIPLLIIYAVILYYLTRPEIKDIFGITGFLS